jgi:hypothetical protein
MVSARVKELLELYPKESQNSVLQNIRRRLKTKDVRAKFVWLQEMLERKRKELRTAPPRVSQSSQAAPPPLPVSSSTSSPADRIAGLDEQEFADVMKEIDGPAVEEATEQAMQAAAQATGATSAVNKPLGRDFTDAELEAELNVPASSEATDKPTAATAAPNSAQPPAVPVNAQVQEQNRAVPSPAFQSPLERSFAVAQKAKTKDDLKTAIDAIVKEMAVEGASGVATTQSRYRNRLAALRDTLKGMPGGMRKRTLKKRRGLNKRNVRRTRRSKNRANRTHKNSR